MVKILLIDDDNVRTRTITSCVKDIDIHVEAATTKQHALELMSRVQFDLVIIDIMLPENSSAITPSKYAGMELIDDIMNLNKIKTPQNIVGVTSEEEVFNEVKSQFDSKMIPIIYWKQSDETWKESLKYKVKYLVKNSYQQNIRNIDSVIITAVDDEYDAVKDSMADWKELYLEDDPCIYLFNKYTVAGEEKTLLLVKLQEMGMTAASNVCTKIILKFSPEKIIMVGICGGVKGKVDLGDLIVASTSWDYGNGKIKPKLPTAHKAYYEFEAAPNQIPSSYVGLDKFKASSQHIFEQIIKEWNDIHQGAEINSKLHIGPMPSGAAVICDSALYEQIIRPQHRKCLGLDMETYAIYYAAKNTVER